MSSQKIVVFDWDGTLANSTPAVVRSVKRLIVERGYPFLTDQQISQGLGLSIKDFITKVWKIEKVEMAEIARRDFYDFFKEEEIKEENLLYPDVPEVLEWVKKQNFTLAIATNRVRWRLNESLSLTGLDSFFDFSITADEAMEKPNSLMMDKLLGELKGEKYNTWMIGDSPCDASFAENVGVHSVIIDRGIYLKESFLNYRNLKVVYDFKELITLLSV